MTFAKGLTRLGVAAGLFAMVLGLSAAFASTTHAQNPPATFYGTAKAGDKVGAVIGTTSCGAAVTADATGFWQMTIAEDAACKPTAGATVGFTLNGAAATQTETWQPLGTPKDVAKGVTLTVAAGGTVTPPKTGDAGLLGTGGASTWMMLGLGLLAVVTIAGGRELTKRVR